MIAAILIILPIFLFSYQNASSSWQPRAYGDPTPTGAILKVTSTPGCSFIIIFGVFSPSPRYSDCGIIIVPPGDQGGDSRGQAKLLKTNGQGLESYNTSIHLEILPSDPSEFLDLASRRIELADSLVINCSIMKHIPEGRWTIFMMFFEGSITSATWTTNGTTVSNQSLSFAGAGVADPMVYYGFVHSPQFGYFWTALLFFSGVTLMVLIVGLYSSLRNEKKDKSA